ncbi:MAG: tRNA (adenosine(37)-N6)-dimethylallyltransferase MiaA [Candidatus Anammoximicrobium sp.]|nr:tRNA (adenosine(37)-N6)-dimethylallyltransferase MiaA [Candidatus Anammoximicrobium sp.]
MNSSDLPVTESASEPSFLDCWFLTGATASGKTGVGIELAQQLDAEIISLDSMALYREMDIGTAKPTAQERASVPHHLLDILSPRDEFSVSNYLEAARRTMIEIRGRGREVLFVGGTPLYLKALLRGIFQGPPADWEFRRAVEEELQQAGLPALYARLQQVDPLSAAKLHPHDKRRIIRALEVYRATGRPISHLQTQFDEGRPAESCRVFALLWSRDVLHRRINQRVDAMFAAGFVEEVRGLMQRHGALSRTALQAVGYREVMAHLQAQADLPATIEAVKARTRQFARHQETWFRSLSECRLVPLQQGATDQEVARQILQLDHVPDSCSPQPENQDGRD